MAAPTTHHLTVPLLLPLSRRTTRDRNQPTTLPYIRLLLSPHRCQGFHIRRQRLLFLLAHHTRTLPHRLQHTLHTLSMQLKVTIHLLISTREAEVISALALVVMVSPALVAARITATVTVIETVTEIERGTGDEIEIAILVPRINARVYCKRRRHFHKRVERHRRHLNHKKTSWRAVRSRQQRPLENPRPLKGAKALALRIFWGATWSLRSRSFRPSLQTPSASLFPANTPTLLRYLQRSMPSVSNLNFSRRMTVIRSVVPSAIPSTGRMQSMTQSLRHGPVWCPAASSTASTCTTATELPPLRAPMRLSPRTLYSMR